MADARHTSASFQGFRSPNYTPVPDELFDDLMSQLSGAALKVLLYIIRRTFGFKKASDNISLQQLVRGITTAEGQVLDHGTGLSKDSVVRALHDLEERCVIVRQRRRSRHHGDEATTYTLNIVAPVSENKTPPGQEIGRPLSAKSDTQETARQDNSVTTFETSKALHLGKATESRNVHTEQPPQISRKRSSMIGFEAVSDTLSRRRPVPPSAHEDHAILRSYIADVARELGDRASLTASTTRALNLYRRSGCTRAAFISHLFEARAITKQSRISQPFPYFFAVLSDLLGNKDVPESTVPSR